MQPNPKTSRPAVKTEPRKQEEVYEQLEMQEEEQSHYMTTIHPNRVEDNSQLVGQISTKTKREKFCVISLMVAVFLACVLVVCLVAVIIHSPLVSGGSGNTESNTSTAGDI